MEQETKKGMAFVALVVSLIVIIFLLVVYIKVPPTELTGKVVEGAEETLAPAVQQKTTCADSDSGRVYGIKGNLVYCENGACSDEKDSCAGKKLTEWYCEGSQKSSIEYDCEFSCDDGACVSLATKYKSSYTGGGGGGGGGGGSGSSGATEISGETYDLGSLVSEQTLYPEKYDSIKFSLAADYTLRINDASKTQVTLVDVGSSQSFALNVGADKNLNLSQDSTADVYVKVSSINSITGKIEIKIRPA